MRKEPKNQNNNTVRSVDRPPRSPAMQPIKLRHSQRYVNSPFEPRKRNDIAAPQYHQQQQQEQQNHSTASMLPHIRRPSQHHHSTPSLSLKAILPKWIPSQSHVAVDKKEEVFGIFRPGGLSHTLDKEIHFFEKILIRIDNKQNKLFLFFLIMIKFFINQKSKDRIKVKKFINFISKNFF